MALSNERSGQSIITYTPMCKAEEFIAPTRQTFIQTTNISLDHNSRYVLAGPIEDTRIFLGKFYVCCYAGRYSNEGSTDPLFSQNIGWANKYPCPPSPPATHQPWFCIKVITRFEKKSILNREKSGRGKGLQGKKDSKLNDAMRSIF